MSTAPMAGLGREGAQDPQSHVPATPMRPGGMPLPQPPPGSLSKLLSAAVPGQYWAVRAHFCHVQCSWAEETAGKQIWTLGPLPLTRTTHGRQPNSNTVLPPVSLICRARSKVFLLLFCTPIKTSYRLYLAGSQQHPELKPVNRIQSARFRACSKPEG